MVYLTITHARTLQSSSLALSYLHTHVHARTPTRTHAHAPTHTHSFVLISLHLRGNQLFVKIWLKLLKVFVAADLLELFIENENKSSKKRQIQISSRARTNLSFVDSSHSPRFFWKFAQEGKKQVQHGQECIISSSSPCKIEETQDSILYYGTYMLEMGRGNNLCFMSTQ